MSPSKYSSADVKTTGVQLVNPPLDQGTCASCTGFAVAAAAETAVATALQIDANKVQLSPYYLYYCSSENDQVRWLLQNSGTSHLLHDLALDIQF
jgi:hypothetical protein